MVNYTIKKMESEDEINGKAYVHYKSWQETYAGLIDAQYLAGMTLQKFTAIAKKKFGQYSCGERWRKSDRLCGLRR